MDSSSNVEQLMVLRSLTERTGVVHEAQLLQLKMWGALSFDFVGKGNWEAQVKPETKTVTYLLNKAKHPKDFAQWVASLDESIHWLLGESWRLIIKQDGKTIYRGGLIVNEDKSGNSRKRLSPPK